MKNPPVFAAWPGLLLLALALVSVSAQARLVYLEDATGRHASENRSLIQWTHSRLVFDREIERVAVGQTKTLEVEVLGGRELLLLAKGRANQRPSPAVATQHQEGAVAVVRLVRRSKAHLLLAELV